MPAEYLAEWSSSKRRIPCGRWQPWVTEPCAGCPGPQTEVREERGVLGHPPPCRPTLSNYERRHDRRGVPAAIPGKHRRDALLDIQATEHVLDVLDARLDLRHEQDPQRWMECQQIDAAAIPIVVEAGFRRYQPSS